MSLFDQASLVVTPNGVKEDKLYSVKPTDGSGDLSVVRATTATRVNSEGLIEVVPKNLLTYSEQFDNASWSKTRTTLTSNATTAPDGNTTADFLTQETGQTSAGNINKSLTFINGNYTFSVFAKKNTKNFIGLRSNSVSSGISYFDLLNGTLGNINASHTAKIESYGNDWYRCSITFTSVAGSSLNLIYIADSSSTTVTDSGGVYLWGAQLETSSVATSYFPTTDRLNIPRLDYTNGSCPSILVEPQRTNLALRSEEFDNSSWAKINANISQNSTISPSGVLDADLLTSTGNTVTSNLHQTISIPSGSATFSVFAKAGNYNIFRIGNVSSSQRAAWFDLSTGSVIGTVNGGTASVENFGNGWFRCIFTANSVASGSLAFIISISSGANSSNAVAGANIYFWGGQVEAGSNATSYIPTVASAVTRNQDLISKTGISDLIGQTEGTMFVDMNFVNNNSGGRISISNGYSDRILIIKNINNTIRFYISRSSILQLDFTTINSFLNNQKIKIAVSLKTANFKIFINGVVVYTQNTGNYPLSLQDFSFTDASLTNPFFGNINSALLFKTQLTDEQCIALTTI